MSTIVFEILFIVVLVLVNGLFALAEMAVVAARKSRLRPLAEAGDDKARAALELAESPDRFLSTVQIGISLVGVLSGAVGGATIAEHLGDLLSRIPWIGPAGIEIGLVIVVLAITYLSLVLGELVPKRLALHSPERIAAAVARPMRILSRLAAPLVRLLSGSTHLVLRLMGVRPQAEAPITEEELKVLLRQGTEAGVFEAGEQEMVEGVFRLGDRRVGALITPRTEVVWLDVDDPPAENLRRVVESAHAWFPVARGDLDHVLGVVRSKDLLVECLAGRPADVRGVAHEPLFVPEATPAAPVLDLLRRAEVKIALVVDEHGGVSGLVTVSDLLEEIVGGLSEDQPQAVPRADRSWLVDGRLTVDEFKDLLQVRELPGETEGYYETVGGFVMMLLGRVPAPADHFEWGGWRFEVVDMDGNRVDKVLVSPAVLPTAPEPGSAPATGPR